MNFDATTICDASIRTSRFTGEIVAAIGGSVVIEGKSILDISECLASSRSLDITQAEYQALLTGLRVASQLNLRSLRLCGDNEQALELIRKHIDTDNPTIPKTLRRRLRTLESLAIVKGSKDEVRRAHDLANRAAIVRLAEIDKQRSDNRLLE